jgi:hypothetical protein
MSKFLWALIWVGWLGVNVGLAQEATKVEPKHY